MFFTPADVAERPFWRLFFGFMQAAADDLGVDLRVITSDNRFKVLQTARTALSYKVPDYALYVYQCNITVDVLPLMEKAGVKSIICNTQPVANSREDVGLPGEKFSQWIGQITPDNEAAGHLAAELLIERGISLGLTARDGKLHMACLGASDIVSSAHLRRQGMEDAVSEDPHAVVDRFISADWQREKAHYKAVRMLDMYPLAHAYWAASDSMALGILDAAREKGLTPSVNFLAVGIDWTEGGVQAVRDGQLLATIGGHFMEGAWALIMALDHFNGHEFTQPVHKSRMQALTRDNLTAYLPVLDQKNWERIDFKRFSKSFTPCVADYEFTPEAVLRQLAGK
ncbi:ABC transporter substrate-binding protein [uncultured Pseudodesulfovibrio sp.]|uniref:ABC transporter substrate-binding protein n=1 Tax=uncultured Pseudodesulfovibrio sp. TaxID=2035858 RepID=UPI0029C85FFB|nr:ABC transporter substrate-binding protein [uncultured Pseudodesulfovibrio sp.]